MNLTVRHIEWLLTMHNCVVIPRIGAVLAHDITARISDDGRHILAPCRNYTFNAQLKVSDGLLEQSVARAKAIPHSMAARIVNDDIDAMIAQLHTHGQLSLGRIGTLIHNSKDNTTLFEPFDTDALTPLASWLPAVAATPIGREITRDEDKTGGAIIATPRARWTRAAKGVAAAAAVVAIAVVASTPISVDNANYASTALPPVSAPHAAYVPSAEIPVLNLCVNVIKPVEVDTAARNAWQREHIEQGFVIDNADDTAFAIDNVENADIQIIPGTEPGFSINTSDSFCVVIASFATERAAKQFIGEVRYKYRGTLGILHQGKRYHIYAASGKDEASARAQLNNGLNSVFDAAWICRR